MLLRPWSDDKQIILTEMNLQRRIGERADSFHIQNRFL
jgi:hypothetical protein